MQAVRCERRLVYREDEAELVARDGKRRAAPPEAQRQRRPHRRGHRGRGLPAARAGSEPRPGLAAEIKQHQSRCEVDDGEGDRDDHRQSLRPNARVWIASQCRS